MREQSHGHNGPEGPEHKRRHLGLAGVDGHGFGGGFVVGQRENDRLLESLRDCDRQHRPQPGGGAAETHRPGRAQPRNESVEPDRGVLGEAAREQALRRCGVPDAPATMPAGR